MKALFLSLLFFLPAFVFAQISDVQKESSLKINQLIHAYSKARETKDYELLKSILSENVDQLVSNGEWRNGINEAIEGMMRSSSSNPGTRSLEVEKIKFLSDEIAVVDCRYLISAPNGDQRKLWSSFVVVFSKKSWKISAIRNMDPGN